MKWVHRMGAGGWSLAKPLLRDAGPKLQVYHGVYWEVVEPVNRLGSVLVFGAKSFDSPPLVRRGARLFNG